MKRAFVVLVMAGLAGTGPGVGFAPRPAGAQELDPCKLLTSAEIEGALHVKVPGPGLPASQTYGEGPLKGATVYGCARPPLGNTLLILRVTRALRTPEERSLFLDRAGMEEARKRGVAVDVLQFPGGDCSAYKAPGGPVVSCYVERKGHTLRLEVDNAAAGVTPQQVKALAEKAAGRLP